LQSEKQNRKEGLLLTGFETGVSILFRLFHLGLQDFFLQNSEFSSAQDVPKLKSNALASTIASERKKPFEFFKGVLLGILPFSMAFPKPFFPRAKIDGSWIPIFSVYWRFFWAWWGCFWLS
jgi:hypothetical protein